MKKLLLVLALTVTALGLSIRAQAQVIVIANPGLKSASVPKSELREIFTGSSSNLKDGSRVTPVLLKEGLVHSEFVAAYLGTSPTGLIICWRGLILSGQGTMPKSLPTEAAMVDYVSRTPGAIGYISKSTPHDNVKVLEIH
jgi:ABC-type phosphate transport system substrate-binding protein